MAEKIQIELQVEGKGAENNIGKVKTGIKGVNNGIKDVSASSSEMGNQLDKATGGAITKFKAFTGTLKGVTTGFKTMRGAIIATGIGALLIAVTALTAAFQGSEEGQNKWNKIMAIVGVLTGNLVDLMADLGEKLIWVFENPQQALKDFANLIKDQLVNRIEGLVELIPKLGQAVSLLFKGEFAEAGKVAVNAASKVSLGVEDMTDKIKAATVATGEFIKEQQREVDLGIEVAKKRADADIIERDLIVERSKLESEIANLRLKSRQEDEFTAEERRQALLDAQKLEDQLLDKETEYLELRRDAQILENTFSRSNKENLTKEAEAIANVNRMMAAKANTARQVQREVNTITKQIEAEQKAKDNEQKAAQKAKDKEVSDAIAKTIADEKTRTDAIGKIQDDFTQKQLDKSATNEIDKINLEETRKLAELERLKASEEQKQEVLNYYSGLRSESEKKTNNFKKDLILKTAQDELKIAQDLEAQKLAAKVQTLDGILSLTNEETALGKAALIGKQLLAAQEFLIGLGALKQKATISIAEANLTAASSGTAVQGGFAKTLSLGFPAAIVPLIGYAITAASIIKGIMSAVKGSKKVAASVGGTGGGSTPQLSLPSTSTSGSQAPAFNVVGMSGTNQIADVFASQSQKPVKAYVVANDVTTAQSLQRNIVKGAEI